MGTTHRALGTESGCVLDAKTSMEQVWMGGEGKESIMMSGTAQIKHRGRAEHSIGLSSSPLHLAWTSGAWASDPRAHSALSYGASPCLSLS